MGTAHRAVQFINHNSQFFIRMKIISTQPEWGQSLVPGYCGFITRERDIVGDGIAWFERFELGLPFVHTFIIEQLAPQSLIGNPAGVQDIRPGSTNNTSAVSSINHHPLTINILEAHATTGVHRATLDQYLGQKNCQCFIRIPLGYTETIGEKIVLNARAHLGEKYAFPLIFADALSNTWFGHGLNWLTRNQWDKFLCWALSNSHQKICSQLVALALQSQFYLRLRGCLRRPADTILPKELGNDRSLWDPCIYKIS
jgi:hypothetical protein